MFNDKQPKDLISLEMKVEHASRYIMKQMFMSQAETKAAYEQALERAIKNVDVVACFQQEADRAVREAVSEFFSYGEGAQIIRAAMSEAMSKFFGPAKAKKKS